MRVEAFLPEASVEGFVLRIVGRLTRTREVNLHAILVRPFVERLRNEFAAIVYLDIAGKRTMMCKPSQRGDNVLTTQRAIDFNRQAFPRVVVHDREGAQASTVKQRVSDEIHTPDFVDCVH